MGVTEKGLRPKTVHIKGSLFCVDIFMEPQFNNPQERPRRLHHLSEVLEIPLIDLRLLCVYCKKELTRAEVYNFACTELNLVYRDDFPYAVCRVCLLFYSKVRKYRYYDYSVYGATLESITKKQLCDLLIRCYRCQSPLTPEEKQLHCDRKRRFHLIAHGWTGSCLGCWRQTSREPRESTV